MVSEQDKTIWETIITALIGGLGVAGIEQAVKAIHDSATKKATQMFQNRCRWAIDSDIATLYRSDKEDERKAARKLKDEFFPMAQKKHVEGELYNLLMDFPTDKSKDRMNVLFVLGDSPDYKTFEKRAATLRHDNILQEALKIAERMRKNGGRMATKDMQKVKEMAAAALVSLVNGLDTMAGAALPFLKWLDNTL